MVNFVVFTDLDGTLLDHDTYSLRRALPALDLLNRRGHKIVPVTSKTAAEVRLWMKQLYLEGPYVYENGCGIMIPDGYFKSITAEAERDGDHWRISIGEDIDSIRQQLEQIASDIGLSYRGFGSMSRDEISSITGLKGDELEMSLDRRHDESFVIDGEYDLGELRAAVKARGLKLLRGGRFLHLTDGCDKGHAVRILKTLFEEMIDDIVTVGIGDSGNDLELFQVVDRAFLVQKPDGSFDPDIPAGAAKRIGGIGPLGWRMVIEEVFADADV